ncbi:MAG TPA: ankyrin repeat domain-containing protein [Chthonomonadaceae bacterium]|nr:ankyrin repeat domain-containing protein [Chthonomonadaceae bacterium]
MRNTSHRFGRTQALFCSLFTLLLLAGTAVRTRADGPDTFPIKLYVRHLKLDARDIAYDPVTQRIFASVGPNVSGRANSITAIDPLTGVLGASVFVGSEPTRIAMSPEGGTLYVMLEGMKALCRFNTLLRKPDTPFPANIHIEDMIAPSGHPDWVVTTNFNPGLSPRHGGGTLYVSGKPIGLYQWGPNILINTPDGDNLYGIYNELGSSGIGKRGITATGPGEGKRFIDNAEENSADIKYEQGKLFASSGKIYDFENPSLLGTCSGGGGLVAPEAKANRVYYLQRAEKGWRFHAFDTRTFVSLGWMDVPGLQGDPTRLVKWGENAYAIRTSASQIVFISPYPDLFLAAQSSDPKTLRMLLDKGANPNAQNADGKTPLMAAAASGRVDACQALLARGADPHLADYYGGTAVMAAAEKGQTAVLAILFAKGAETNAKRTDGATALLLAALNGSTDAVRLLLDKGANINATTQDKHTILMQAILAGRTAVARLLIARKADVRAKSDNGDTALKIAVVEGRTELIPLLRQAGAKE